MPVVASNRIGREVIPGAAHKPTTFYGASFITGPQGQVLAQVRRAIAIAIAIVLAVQVAVQMPYCTVVTASSWGHRARCWRRWGTAVQCGRPIPYGILSDG